MTRNLKALGLALVAVLALGAWVAQGASASGFVTDPVSTIRGEEVLKNYLDVTGVETFCEDVSFHGVTSEASVVETLTITPSYKECEAESIFGTINVTVTGFVKETGCNWVFSANVRLSLECATGKEVTIDAATCTIHVPPQNNLSAVNYTTGVIGLVKHELTVDLSAEAVTTNHTDGFGCPLPSGGESATGYIEGRNTVVAEKFGELVDLTVV